MKNSKAFKNEFAYEVENWSNLTLDRCQFLADQEYEKKANSLEFIQKKRNRGRVDRISREWKGEKNHRLPWNLATNAWPKSVEEVTRFCGWIRAAANFPALVRLISRSTSQRGINSPYTYVDLWDLAAAHPSPGHFSRFLMKVKKRAAQILEPYGLQPSWVAMAQVFVRSSQFAVGKTAIKVAGETIRRFLAEGKRGKSVGEFSGTAREVLIKARGLRDALSGPRGKLLWAFEVVEAGEYSCLREALADHRLCFDATDGVELWLDTKSEGTLHGVKTMKGYSDFGSSQWLVLYGGRSYHHEIYHSWETLSESRRRAIKNALGRWKKQDEEDAKEKAFLDILLPEDRSVLVFISDSLETGNCHPGTLAFMRSNGWGGRNFVPVSWLIKHQSRKEVRRVLTNVASKL